MNARDRRRLRQMLNLATDYHESLIDAHQIGYCRRGGQIVRTIPAEHMPLVRRCERDIAAWRKLVERLEAGR